ncbi:MAG: serine--tRNA ligase [Rhodospirillaceae bacterium]|nr:MAG: serine--tRNA ligase [Rhodospirillaceae bacterium]
MHDIRKIRDNPEAFDAGLKRRGVDAISATLIELDTERRRIETQAQEIQAARNKVAKQIGMRKAKGEDASDLIEQVSKSKAAQAEAEVQAKAKTDELNTLLATIPNIPDASVPDGADENENVEIRKWGVPTAFEFEAKDHVDLGEGLGQMDFEIAAKMSGARFVVLTGQLARMERALANFMLDVHTLENGYMEVNPPALVKSNALFGTGQLPKFAEDLFHTDDDYYLIPTGEVPLTNIAAGKTVNEADLPARLTAKTWCFRSEAGSAGKDTRGMIRQHQFTKVEMVTITRPEDSAAELERKTECAEGILQRLDIPYRTVALCTGDLGFGAVKTYDIEVWLPAQNTYREISSCSNTGDFQARRMNARFKREGQKKPEFVHTLNGSGLAVGRCLVAVMENYQNEDGTITIPKALLPYMANQEVIETNA